MVVEGDFEIAMEDEFTDLATEASSDDETYEMETEEETDETEEDSDKSEAEAETEANTKSKKFAKDEICKLVRSKPNRLKANIVSHHGVKEGPSAKIGKLLEKEISEDCPIHESEEKKSRKVGNNGSKHRDIRRYCCQICGLVRAKRKRLEAHIMLHHGAEIETREIEKLIEKKKPEDFGAEKSRTVESNGLKVRELRRYCCTLCGLVRSKRKLLKNHIMLEHSGEMNIKGDMNKLMEKKCSEDYQRRYSCQICGVLRSKRVLLKLHMFSCHGPEALKSDKKFASEGPGKYSLCVCSMCGMPFVKPSHLRQHEISHSALEGLRNLASLSKRWETALEARGC